ncbi:MAG TPA: fructosamine kinase family protein [Wenzhouxiangellaceae bacterium]|nr:fructosamine kinase family protein [Wenzhouxiangellaceae bacterium]
MNNQITNAIANALGWKAGDVRSRPVSGGSIAGSWRLENHDDRVFVKTMSSSQASMLDAERDGLARLAGSGAVRTPAVLGHGTAGDTSWLALEWLDLRPLDGAASAALGRKLCELHRRRAETFGLETDNFIGATPQPNAQAPNWTEFLFEQRLGFQIDLLGEREGGFGARDTARLKSAWQRRFPDYAPEPSLLHGDLWGGNAAMLSDGQPVLFDPAVHFGDRECDLAMADLFGGFGPAFFRTYEQAWPLESGWEDRRRFYQLYHLLNHASLFGGHYLSSSRRLIDDLAA